MKSSKKRLVFLVMLIGTLALAAECEDESTDTDDGNNGPTSPGSPSGCDNELPEQMKDCTDDDLKEYNDCLFETCEDKYKACLGDNYMQGDYSGGTCEELQNCVDACGCDQACVEDCSVNKTTPACLGCITELAFCGMPCMENLECATQR